MRVLEAADLTATCKIRKVALQREGFEPKDSADVILYRDDAAARYLPLTQDVLERIRAGELRF